MTEQPEPIPLRYLDLTIPGGLAVSLTLYPADSVVVLGQPDRIIVQLKEKSDETFTVFLGPGMTLRESTGLQYPRALDENGEPRQFATQDDYRAWLATTRVKP